MSDITLVECPRDAMQGWSNFIPTQSKIAYLNQLLKVGFDVLDFGSFVSPKAIPQLADTADVLKGLDLSNTNTRLLAIIANSRGAEQAVAYDEISYLGFPFSISETFQLRNTNKTIAASLQQVEEIHALCSNNNKELVVYISMGFGNPYGDTYNADIAITWFAKLRDMGIKTIAMADTVGLADPELIRSIYNQLIPEFPDVQIGAHFHATPQTMEEKLATAYESGCTRFDSSIKGIGGCPMAEDKLVGNIATEDVVAWALRQNLKLGLNQEELVRSVQMAGEIFV